MLEIGLVFQNCIIIIIITFIKYMEQVKNISHTTMYYLNLKKLNIYIDENW